MPFFLIIVILMASKQPFKLFDTRRMLEFFFIASGKFVKHTILRTKRQTLLIGEERSPLMQQLMDKLKGHEITIVSTGSQRGKQPDEVRVVALKQGDYSQLEAQLQGRQYDSIIVLPGSLENSQWDISQPEIATQYPSFHTDLLLRNVFAYRIASKYLSVMGVLIFSGSEKEFIKQKKDMPAEELELMKDVSHWTSTEIVNLQTSYLGLVVGDRDYTHLRSFSLVALSQELMASDPSRVAHSYAQWASHRCLPAPGSFALYRRQTSNNRCGYIEYL